MRSVVALGADDLGADDVESNVIEVTSHINAAGESSDESILLRLPADAFRDLPMLEWLLASAGAEETTFDDFNDLMVTHHNERKT
jgi:hypothetical protein